jgi:hypothetical protein
VARGSRLVSGYLVRYSAPSMLMAARVVATGGQLALVLLCALGWAAWGVVTGASAMQDHCDARLRPLGGADGYQMRGDRCEGLYADPVSRGEVWLVGIAWSGKEKTAIQPGRPFPLAWQAPPRSEHVHIRAYSLHRRLFYRMDTVRPSGDEQFAWPSEVLGRVRLSPTDLGVVSWVQLQLGGQIRDIYLPVAVGVTNSPSAAVELTLLSDVGLREVYVTIFPVNPDGRSGKAVHRDVPLKRPPYPANVAIAMPLPTLQDRGIYRVDIGASFTDTGSSALSRLLYIPAPTNRGGR